MYLPRKAVAAKRCCNAPSRFRSCGIAAAPNSPKQWDPHFSHTNPMQFHIFSCNTKVTCHFLQEETAGQRQATESYVRWYGFQVSRLWPDQALNAYWGAQKLFVNVASDLLHPSMVKFPHLRLYGRSYMPRHPGVSDFPQDFCRGVWQKT